MNIQFEGIGAILATFAAGTAVEGAVCKMASNGTLGACSDGDSFCGVAVQVRDGAASAQLRGYVEVAYTGTDLKVGQATLAANGAGGVKSADSGRSCLIVKVDTTGKTAGLFL